MSLLDHLFGNASQTELARLQNEFNAILIEGEELVTAYSLFRDKWIFTNKRLILLNVQGVTGSKREYLSIPYTSINQFGIETAGAIEDDCELKLWIKGRETPLVQEFKRSTDIKELQRTLARYVLK